MEEKEETSYLFGPLAPKRQEPEGHRIQRGWWRIWPRILSFNRHKNMESRWELSTPENYHVT